MTPVGKWFRNWLEKKIDRYYEGPQPPVRLRTMSFDFSMRNPRATRNEWMEFASGLAGEAYCSGYLRGFEYTERSGWESEISPDDFADAVIPGWRDTPALTLLPGGYVIVPDEPDDDSDELARHLEDVERFTRKSYE